MARKEEFMLVFGGSGGVGSALTRLLAEQEKPIKAASRSSKFSVPAGVKVMAVNALDVESVKDACTGAAIIYHCAHPKEDYSQFPAMTKNIVTGAQEAGAKLVMAASAYPYGKVDRPMTEDMAINPEAPSGDYHAKAAKIVMDAHKRGRVQATIGRASNFFGPNATRMWPGIDFRAALNGDRASVIGDVDQLHTYTFVDDFAKGLITLGEEDASLGEIWHIPSAETDTTRHFLEKVYRTADTELRIRAARRPVLTIRGWFNAEIRPALEVLYQFERPFVLDHSKYQKAFGGSPTPHDEAIRQTIEWVQEHPANPIPLEIMPSGRGVRE